MHPFTYTICRNLELINAYRVEGTTEHHAFPTFDPLHRHYFEHCITRQNETKAAAEEKSSLSLSLATTPSKAYE